MIRILYFVVILLGVTSTGVLSARAEDGAFKMSFPLSCTLGTDCWMLYYVDVNRTPVENVPMTNIKAQMS